MDDDLLTFSIQSYSQRYSMAETHVNVILVFI